MVIGASSMGGEGCADAACAGLRTADEVSMGAGTTMVIFTGAKRCFFDHYHGHHHT